MGMTAKTRLLTAIDGGTPDRLPVTTHFLMPQFLDACMGGISEDQFFDTCGWDPITYTTPHRPEPGGREYFDPNQAAPGFLESRRVASDHWRVESEPLPAGRTRPPATASSRPRARSAWSWRPTPIRRGWPSRW